MPAVPIDMPPDDVVDPDALLPLPPDVVVGPDTLLPPLPPVDDDVVALQLPGGDGLH